MDRNYIKIKWIKYNLPNDLHKKFQEKAMSEGFSLYAASRLLAEKYINGDFDLERNE